MSDLPKIGTFEKLFFLLKIVYIFALFNFCLTKYFMRMISKRKIYSLQPYSHQHVVKGFSTIRWYKGNNLFFKRLVRVETGLFHKWLVSVYEKPLDVDVHTHYEKVYGYDTNVDLDKLLINELNF